MIYITLETALSVYFLTYIGGILAMWIFAPRDDLRRNSCLDSVATVSCSICAFIYRDNGKSLSKCPRCGSYNKFFKNGKEMD